MASHPAAPLRIELGNVQNLHGKTPRPRPRIAFSLVDSGPTPRAELSPFEALAAHHGRPLKIAILSDFTRISYANGAAFQTRFLYQELRRCGHKVTVIGPKDPDARPEDLAPGTVELPSFPVRMYPGLHVPVPLARWVYDAKRWDFDLVFAQTTSLLLEFGVWLRKMLGVPLVCVNTTHLVAAYDVLLPERLAKYELVHAGLHVALKRPYERYFASIYNESDGLVVLSEGLRTYWRENGVTGPIHVIPRAVTPEIFDKPLGDDPYLPFLKGATGPRLLSAGRHTREKAQDRLIRIFARHILPREPLATLTVLGQGPDTEYYRRLAEEEGVSARVFFPGEAPFTQMADFYAYADVFVHASLSETYGNVLGEALWCGTPTVAFADGMGASFQLKDEENGVLLSPGGADGTAADRAFGAAVSALLGDPERRARLGTAAARRAREHSSPRSVQLKMTETFLAAHDHAKRSGLRPALEGPRLLQWMTTFSHFRRWAFYNSALAAVGRVRQPHAKGRAAHPAIHGR
jgi:1,2-diacylglycerol 3-alpha-glucosyltransferase